MQKMKNIIKDLLFSLIPTLFCVLLYFFLFAMLLGNEVFVNYWILGLFYVAVLMLSFIITRNRILRVGTLIFSVFSKLYNIFSYTKEFSQKVLLKRLKMSKLLIVYIIILSLFFSMFDSFNSYETRNEVYNEIKDTKNSDQLMSLIQNKIIILKKKINNQDFENYCRENYTLNIGELSVIYIGNELKITTQDYYCIIDEKKARKLSKEENLKLCGTIGFLEYLLNLNLISKNEFKNYLKILKLKGFRLPKAYNKL